MMNNDNFCEGFVKTARESLSKWQKTKSKFSRSQQTQKLDKKKSQMQIKEQHRICFISPNKIRVVTSPDGKVHPIIQNFNSPGDCQFSQEESVIQKDSKDVQNLNDSLLSMYQQLNDVQDKKKYTDMFLLKSEIENLKLIIEEQRGQKQRQYVRKQDFNDLQQFLMERESYICDITEKNIILNQKLSKIQQQKQSIQKQLVYLRNSYQSHIKKSRKDVLELKHKASALNQENKSLSQRNNQLKSQIQQLLSTNNQSTTAFQSSIGSNPEHVNGSQNHIGSQKQLALTSSPVLLFKSQELNLNSLHQNQSNGLTSPYKELLSSRSSRLFQTNTRQKDREEENDHYGCSCSCNLTIKKLNQKIRYNQIEIDILKRMKGKGTQIQSDNQKLKKIVKTLNSRIEYITTKQKQKKKRQLSSSLQLSLSPHKGKSKMKT